MKSLMFSFLIVTLLFVTGCSSGVQVPSAVCEYGNVTCETIDYLCANYPDIPPAVCEYSELACSALSVLCSSDPGSDEYKMAELQLLKIIPWIKAIDDSLRLNVR